jgi:hypothetical protein
MSKRLQKDSAPVENYSNKIFQALVYLNEVERKRLLKYLRSPYFVQSKPLMALCEAMLFEIEKGRTGFDRQIVWKKLFPEEAYDDVNFRKYCSDLLKHTFEFMAYESLAGNPTRLTVETLGFVVDHKIELLFKTSFQSAKEKITRQPFRSASHFHYDYLIEKKYFSMMEFDMKAETRTNLEEISFNLDVYYWIEKLKISCSALSHQKTSNQKYNIPFLEEIAGYLKKYSVEELPELAIYYYSFLTLFEGENIQHYFNLKRLLEKHGQVMPQKEAIELIDSVLNYCASHINKGNRIFLQEYFDLFEDAVRKGIFLQNGTLATVRFNNILASALGLGKLEWAENFIQNFKHFLPEESRENTYTFNLARVYRFQKKHEKVIDQSLSGIFSS